MRPVVLAVGGRIKPFPQPNASDSFQTAPSKAHATAEAFREPEATPYCTMKEDRTQVLDLRNC